MIKFFRKIRQNLLMENKTGKYFKYAIGEIILVVIGILIALQINNWNEVKKEKRQELKQLKALKLEFDKNLVSFDSIFNHHIENEKATQSLMRAKGKNYNIETLDSLYLKTIYNYNFDPSRGIYNSLINSGQIELISNDLLKYKIAEIQDLVVDYIDDENLVRYYSTDVVISFTVNQMPYNPLRFYKNRSSEERAKHNKLFQEMIDNRIFIEHLSILSVYRIGVFKEGKKVRKGYQEIIELINKEISKIK
jgi:hypothetical protein